MMPSVEKLVRWLRWMQRDDVIAGRGLEAFENMLKRGGNDAGYAGIFEQGVLENGEGYPFFQHRWSEVPSQPQFLSDFHQMDDLLDSDGIISTMVSQARPDMLPMPPMYGNPYG